jgi:thiamine-monophosphate kinase
MGPGDDCAVLSPPLGHQLCVSSDTFIEGVHFPVGASGALVARRTLAGAVSDLAAMGSEPLAVTGALTLVTAVPHWLASFSDALSELIQDWQLPLVGGNISRGRELSLTWTVIGSVPTGSYVTRSGASVGEDIYVSGWPGRAGLALSKLQSGQQPPEQLAKHYLAPEPRLLLGQHLRGLASAMIDVSDGVLADLNHLLNGSALGARLSAQDMAFDELLQANADSPAAALTHFLTAGDDYELCFIAPASARAAIDHLALKLAIPLNRIGETKAESGLQFANLPKSLTESMLIKATGYRHFI